MPQRKFIVQGSELKKQEGYIADPSGSIKIIFWGNHTDEVQQGSTYFFNKVRVKISQDQKYLNTPKQESECIIKSAEPFKETLPVVDEVSTSKEVIGSIIGISNVNKYSSCCTCAKKVTIKGKLAYCERCKMTQKLSACSMQWSFKIVIHTEDNPRQKINLNIYGQQMVQKLFTICEITEAASEDEAEVAILSSLSSLSSALTHSLIKLSTLIPSTFKHTTVLYQFINIENSTNFLQSLYRHHKRCKENC